MIMIRVPLEELKKAMNAKKCNPNFTLYLTRSVALILQSCDYYLVVKLFSAPGIHCEIKYKNETKHIRNRKITFIETLIFVFSSLRTTKGDNLCTSYELCIYLAASNSAPCIRRT